MALVPPVKLRVPLLVPASSIETSILSTLCCVSAQPVKADVKFVQGVASNIFAGKSAKFVQPFHAVEQVVKDAVFNKGKEVSEESPSQQPANEVTEGVFNAGKLCNEAMPRKALTKLVIAEFARYGMFVILARKFPETVPRK